ncbi:MULTISPECIES: hypothetical protein [Petrimonas]|jgi:hypothetical protein|uniref:Uncharacterized protein n=1 Tax=Petrimonas mucosa TaxID=1642646 RepID=A0A1G4GBA6_9BACT|nr:MULTISPECIES: hypothetical protein [Petrimonas]MDD3561128.1 hypothetical protein [Petrimonas mucosa]SCM59809.1 hypothetical protein ING2E5A_3017 [Petrimonas mucosa]SFU60840.1 hypothetical protein SAMN05216364_10365 [Porphyromonadaceae bacterium KHP3R9]HHT28799.1 hypothetical protein [Petrimonas mucosa]
MGMFFFYNNRKPRKFNYTPVFFDPEKEERKEQMEKRIRRIREELAREEGKTIETPPQPGNTDFGEAFLSQTRFLKKRKEKEKEGKKPFYSSNFTILLLIIILMVIFYFVFLR